MRDKLLQIRVDDDFLSKLEYLRKINGYKTQSETVRKIVEKRWSKERLYNPPIGEWLEYTANGTLEYMCSECGAKETNPKIANYCWHCGAKMYISSN